MIKLMNQSVDQTQKKLKCAHLFVILFQLDVVKLSYYIKS